MRPEEVRHALDLGVQLQQVGRLADAVRLYEGVLAALPGHAVANHLLGLVRFAQGDAEEALTLIGAVLAREPSAQAHAHYGVVLQSMDRFEEALESFDRALAFQPDHDNTLTNRGAALWALRRYEDALAAHDAALAIAPNNVEAHYNRGIVLQELGRLEEAIASYDRALALQPHLVPALNARAGALTALKRHEEALVGFDSALALAPDNVEILNNRGAVLLKLGRAREALATQDAALARQPNHVAALYNRGMALWALKQHDAALAAHDAVLAIQPGHIDALYSRGTVLQSRERFAEALAEYDQVLALAPGHRYALSAAANCALRLCDWRRAELLAPQLAARIAAHAAVVAPLTWLGYSDDASLQLACARDYTSDLVAVPPRRLSDGHVHDRTRIRVAYLSGDFHQHATAHLIAELFERHDRERFEIIGASFGPNDYSPMRARLIKAFDRFYDLSQHTDSHIAQLLYALEIDIAVDLKGHTQGARPNILVHRPAPIQVNYLGYPGTMGCDFMDYILADQVVLPFDRQPFYSERIVHLPDSYQANDSRRAAGPMPSRAEEGLPERGFVFCCFNNNWKITAPLFDVWMRLLDRVPGSVLWLLRDNDAAETNLRREAQSRGIDPLRLIFAARTTPEAHLARHVLADLMLDTLPYNAHTTASDALWMGLPLVTCRGETFAGRVGASLLRATGLPELVADSLMDYQDIALTLAVNTARLTGIRRRLVENRDTSPLFDTSRFCRHVEAAYETMWRIARDGAPRPFSIAG